MVAEDVFVVIVSLLVDDVHFSGVQVDINDR
jgi:hypothetical protein